MPAAPAAPVEPAADERPDPANDAVDDLLPAAHHARLLQAAVGRALPLLHHDDGLPDGAAVLRHGMGTAPALATVPGADPHAGGSLDAAAEGRGSRGAAGARRVGSGSG